MTFTWRYEKADGTEIAEPPASATQVDFPTQGEAESWVGETWRDLLDEGVDAVTLFSDDERVYGPMSLHPAAG